MKTSDDGVPAFPSHGSMGEVAQEGMSLRDWFAGQALAGYFAADDIPPTFEQCAKTCYAMADVMLAERNK